MSRALLFLCLLLTSRAAAQNATPATVNAAAASTTAAESVSPRTRHELASHPDFRVRAQAAEILGESHDPNDRAPLELALADRHPAVRTAAVTSLGKLGRAESLTPLRRLRTSDPSAAVRAQCDRAIRAIDQAQSTRPGANAPQSWQGVRYVVYLGEVQDRAQHTEPERFHATLSGVLARELARAPGFFFANESTPALSAEASRRHVPVYRLDASISAINLRVQSNNELYARSEIRLILVDGASGAMRGTVSGAASSTEPSRETPAQRQRLVERTLGASVRSALVQLPQALAPRREAPPPRRRR